MFTGIHKSKNTNPGLKNKDLLLPGWLLFAIYLVPGCVNTPEKKDSKNTIDYIKQIPGINEIIPPETAQKGEVLISYSDCYTCHTIDHRSVGPSFKDIAKRYPVNKAYIEMLAKKVIIGGNRSWGYPVMDPHPALSLEDAKMMVTYILSLKQ